jgi:Domain of unknown function (DUF6378)
MQHASDRCLDVLQQAAEIVAQRRQQYGPPAEHFQQVARRWSSTLGTAVTPQKVLLCQLDLKLARLAHDPRHHDSLVDLIGYSFLLHELAGDASAEGPEAAEVADIAEPEGCRGCAAAEALLRSAEVKRSAG